MPLQLSLTDFEATLVAEIQRVSPVERFQKLDQDRLFDVELHTALAALGTWGLGVEDHEGGAGGSTLHQLLALRCLGQHATSMGMFCVVQFLCTRLLKRHAQEQQRKAFLAPLARGRVRASFCLTEAGGGTDILASMQTRADRHGDVFRISGAKTWISGASSSDFYIVVARTAPGRADGITMFIVPRDAPGIAASRIASFAVNAYEACEVTFDAVEVPVENVLGVVGQGFRQLIATLNAERLCAAANALGIARGAMQVAAAYVQQRQAFGKPLAAMQSVQHKLAEVAMAYELAWTYLVAAAGKDDRGEPIDVASSIAKVTAANAARLAADIGMELMGAHGFDLSNPMQRYFRDHRLYVIAPLNNDMSRSLIAERYFGFDRAG